MRNWSRRVLIGAAACGLGAVGLISAATVPAAAASGASGSTSNNWAGYNVGVLDRGTPLTSVSAQWTVPTVTAHQSKQNEYSSMWIGIGGGCVDTGCTAADGTLIQVGTEQDVDSSGKASYSAWWETIPAPSVNVAFSVNPGDKMSATISQGAVPETWNVTITDVTTNQTDHALTDPMPYTSDYSTAEFITETPVVLDSTGSGFAALPDLKNPTPTFDQAKINGAGAAFTAAERVTLVDSNQNPIATPSAPDPDTDGFSVCTWATSCTAPSSS